MLSDVSTATAALLTIFALEKVNVLASVTIVAVDLYTTPKFKL